MTDVLVPASRVERWVENFNTRHGGCTLSVADGALHGLAEDGSTFTARLPFDVAYAGSADVAGFAAQCHTPGEWGVLLVRRAGFAVARMSGSTEKDSKVGRRHVQGRTKAGGQSQQRFARRREGQAREAYRAAADHAARVLGERSLLLVTGGDREGVRRVLEDRRLAGHTVAEPWLDVPDPRRSVLDTALRDARSVRVAVSNA